jgi:hypothetical protein
MYVRVLVSALGEKNRKKGRLQRCVFHSIFALDTTLSVRDIFFLPKEKTREKKEEFRVFFVAQF